MGLQKAVDHIVKKSPRRLPIAMPTLYKRRSREKFFVLQLSSGQFRTNHFPNQPEELHTTLREYFRVKRPKVYLFSSTQGERGLDQPIADNTISYACSEAAKRAGIKKRVGAHTLRRSFATAFPRIRYFG
jgi:hypothetical protein